TPTGDQSAEFTAICGEVCRRAQDCFAVRGGSGGQTGGAGAGRQGSGLESAHRAHADDLGGQQQTHRQGLRRGDGYFAALCDDRRYEERVGEVRGQIAEVKTAWPLTSAI